jgi:hypothetical protein
MKISSMFVCLLLLAGGIAGCAGRSGSAGDGSTAQYNYAAGSCYNAGQGPGYARDYSYGDRYAMGHNRQC